jgi:hypothetical protein
VATPFALNLPMLLRLNMFQLLQAVPLNSIGLDVGVPARAWTGEAYEGHIFWDELFIFPFFNYRMPEITRSRFQPEPAVEALDERPYVLAAARRQRHRLQCLAILRGHRRS